MAADPDYIRIGSVKRTPVGEIADVAARRLMSLATPEKYALTLEPAGIVMIEPVGEAVPDEVVGVYCPKTLQGEGALVSIRLFRRIREDLKEAADGLSASA